MRKTIFSKGLRVGGARISTVGLGVLLGVILGLAATTAFPTPTVAQAPPTADSLTQRVAEDEALSWGGRHTRLRSTPCGNSGTTDH
jgi:hypothetical protein